MDFERAREIIDSPDTYEVFYNNKLVWIHDLNPENKTAHIRILSDDTAENVPVNDLKDGYNLH